MEGVVARRMTLFPRLHRSLSPIHVTHHSNIPSPHSPIVFAHARLFTHTIYSPSRSAHGRPTFNFDRGFVRRRELRHSFFTGLSPPPPPPPPPPPLWENWSEIQPGDSLGMRFVDAAFDQLFSVRAIRRVVVICSPILWFLNNYVPFCRFPSIELLKIKEGKKPLTPFMTAFPTGVKFRLEAHE